MKEESVKANRRARDVHDYKSGSRAHRAAKEGLKAVRKTAKRAAIKAACEEE